MKKTLLINGVLFVFITTMYPVMTFAKKDKHKEKKAETQSFEKWEKKTGNGQVVSGSSFHKGPEVDIDGNKGDKVGAFRGGKVIYSGSKGSFGNTVIIQDKKGNTEQYSHLDNINVNVGKKLKPNQKIGTIGNTGNVISGHGGDGSHLHYQEANKDGMLISPR